MTNYSLDDVARTSDEAAVRARFDAATLTILRLFGILFAAIGLPHLAQADTVMRTMLGAISFGVGALVFVLVRKRATNAVARFIQQRARATAIVFLLLEAGCLIVYHGGAKGGEEMAVFATLIPILAVLFRLLPAEHVLLHGLLAAIAVIAMVTWPPPHAHLAKMLVPALVMNGAALVVSLSISRRRRRTITREWTDRRTSAREQIRMRDELRYARELQLSMLPECAPDLAWADICSVSIPATEVGGDYFDYFVEGDRVALVCGDVAGHGMASGLVLSAVRGGLTVMRDAIDDPAAVLARLHDLVVRTTRRRTLVTISIVLLDRASHRATIASAGHPPVIVRRADGTIETLALYAPPLGVRLPLAIPQRQIGFAAGDVFILHSDGIYETRDAEGEGYGLDRLQEVVRARGGDTAEVLRDAILRDVASFRGECEQHDDVTVVVCRMV